MPAASRVEDDHHCPMVENVPHEGGPVTNGAPTVKIGGNYAARVTDKLLCKGAPDSVVTGSSTVTICGKAAARMSDKTAHGGVLTGSCPTVRIGDVTQSVTLMSAGAPLVERCEKPGDEPPI